MNKKRFYIGIILFCACISACSTNDPFVKSLDPKNIYNNSSLERYYLSDLPKWANFSSSSDCLRESPIRFMNFQELKGNYSLDYQQFVHFQHMLNRRFTQFRSKAKSPLNLKDETYIFYDVLELLLGASYDFTAPNFAKVSLLWIDPHLEELEVTRQYLKRDDLLEGHPIIVSACLSSLEMEGLAQRYGWNALGAKVIGSEMFAPYAPSASRLNDFVLDVEKFFQDKRISLFGIRRPVHIRGSYRFIQLKEK